MMSQLDVAFMRHITHEKMKSYVVQGNVKMKSPVQQKKPSSRMLNLSHWSQRHSVNSCICLVVFALIYVGLYWLLEMPPS